MSLRWTRERSLFEETKKKSTHDGAATPRVLLLPSFFTERGKETCVYIYIYTLGATNFQRRWRQHLKLHARQINRPLFRKAKCYSRIVLGEKTLLLIFKFEDGKVAKKANERTKREREMYGTSALEGRRCK